MALQNRRISVDCRNARGRLRIRSAHRPSWGTRSSFPRDGLDHVPRAKRQEFLEPSASLGEDCAAMPPALLFWVDIHAGPALDTLGGACGSDEVDRRGLPACLPRVAARHGLDG